MDHLQLPKDPTSPLPRIPYLHGEHDHRGDFWAYQRYHIDQWEVYCPPDSSQGPWLHQASTQLPDGTAIVEAFLQRWIFFGLLRELLCPANLFNEDDYIGTDDLGKYVHTKGIAETLREWSSGMEGWSIDRKQSLSDRLYHCVGGAISSLLPFYESSDKLNLRYDIKISLIVTIELVVESASSRLPPTSSGSYWHRLGYFTVSDESTDTLMLRSGWCPSEAIAALNKSTSVAGKLYLQRMQRPKLDLDHSKCTRDECTLVQIKVDEYGTRHVEKSCACDLLGPDPAAIAECLDNNSFPLLRVTGGDNGLNNLALEVVPYCGTSPYVAISHVWADGLGNPHATELRQCQIVRLQKLVRGLRGRIFKWGDDREERPETRNLLLWCDSLCCPTIPREGPTVRASELKQAAIGKLREVYQNAAYVLVLDRTLDSIQSLDMTDLEVGTRIVTSKWTHRLWTYQESVLAQKVIVQFADRAVDFRDIWMSFRERSAVDILAPFFYRDILFQIVQLRSPASSGSLQEDYLSTLIEAVRYRRVTLASDEALCVATILGLDASVVAGATDDMRIPTMWQLLSNTSRGIRPDIIFTPLPRLSTAGYRWAPRSLQQPLSDKEFHGVGCNDYSKAVWTPSGLRLRRDGWRIALGSPLWGFHHTHDDLSKITAVLGLKHTNGEWYSIKIYRHLDLDAKLNIGQALQDRSKDWYLIPDYPSDGTPPVRALLVYAEVNASRAVHRSAALLGINRMGQQWEAIHRVTDQYASILQRHVVTRAMQVRFANEILTEFILALLPNAFRRLLSPLFGWYTRAVAKVIRSPFEGLLKKYAQQADASVRVFTARSGARTRAPPTNLSGLIYSHFNGVHGTVLEAFDADREWCVD